MISTACAVLERPDVLDFDPRPNVHPFAAYLSPKDALGLLAGMRGARYVGPFFDIEMLACDLASREVIGVAWYTACGDGLGYRLNSYIGSDGGLVVPPDEF
jgi:hypothetical protein